MKEFVIYTVSRIGLFVASYAVVAAVYLLVTGGNELPIFWPFLLAIVISSVGSLFFLKGQRARFARVVERRAAQASRRFDEARSKEDEPDGVS